MAKQPLVSPGIAPYDAPAYELNVVCAAPGCDQPAQDPHHLWRRSFLAGAYDWVQIPELDAVVGNVIGLCRAHHDQIEMSSAWITLEQIGGGMAFCWTGLLTPPEVLGWQPPVRVLNGASTEPPDDPESRDDPDKPPGYEYDVTIKTGDPIPVAIIDGVCPSCKRPLPHPKHEGEPETKRPRRTWSVTVPTDERENGADVLDELLSASRERMALLGLPYGEEKSTRYFVLSAALALFSQHADQLMADS